MHDLLIRGGGVVDGSGSPGFAADVAVRHGRIAAVGRDLGPATRVIDATGMVVAPGFIDIHTHADIALLARPAHEPKVMQGVTTEVFSNCGLGFAPVTSAEALATQRRYLKGLFGDDEGVSWDWRGGGRVPRPDAGPDRHERTVSDPARRRACLGDGHGRASGNSR